MTKEKKLVVIFCGMPVLMLALAAVVGLLSGCSNETGTRETLQSAGYTNIQTHGWDAFGCGQDDTFATKFTATNPAGQPTKGVVCCGLLKSCTIRF